MKRAKVTEPSVGESGWLRGWLLGWVEAWNRFWFSERAPYSLAVIRIATGAMLVYVHIIWARFLTDFMGPTAWIDQATIRQLHANDWGWSWLQFTSSPLVLWGHEAIAILASAMMMIGMFSRLAIPLAWFMTLMVCHRMTGALFGLDQIVVMLAMYLMWSRCGCVLSVDSWLQRNRPQGSWLFPACSPANSNNIATRLIQLHLCVIYLFGGLSKLRGEMWWDGSALWYTSVNYEYQSLDITWLGHFPLLIGALTAATIFWETFYCALVWPQQTRPLVLAMAVMVHGGIALALGMVTFGTIMIVANISFIDPAMMRVWLMRIPGLSGMRLSEM